MPDNTNDVYDLINNNITIRFNPMIYAFSTDTLPKYLKVGDTFRGVDNRLAEWKKVISENLGKEITLKKENSWSAKIGELYFRDYSVHQYLEEDLEKRRLDNERAKLFSKEFFENTTVSDVDEAIKDITDPDSRGKYTFYKTSDKNPDEPHYNNDQDWKLRDNQKEVVKKYQKAIKDDKESEFLMFAVMRFGKSFTALQCAKKTDCEKVLVVSAKADVMGEWKRTVEMPKCFKEYRFITDKELKEDQTLDSFLSGSDNKNKTKIVLFLTLQNLSGKDQDDVIKKRLEQVYDTEFDLLIVDETHFGAWSEKYGEPIREEDGDVLKKEQKEYALFSSFVNKTNEGRHLQFKRKLHLSGTPYRLLMEDRFNEKNLIATVQFKDILEAKQQWDEDHVLDIEYENINIDTGKPYQEYDNPYFGFPKMLRFAFDLPEEAKTKLEKSNVSWSLSDLFECKKDDNPVSFVHEAEVLHLLRAIDGSEEDGNVLGFLDVPKIRDNDVCKHIVMVLPRKKACDAMAKLLEREKSAFRNLGSYQVINIAGTDANEKRIDRIQSLISKYEKKGEKTISLTVRKMLTGVTVPEWDTMLMLKDTSSAQEYDQAIYRIQNQFVVEKKDDDGNVIKLDMKPQTILADFSPVRMFEIEGMSTRIVNAVNNIKDENIEDCIRSELEFFPIISYNAGKIKKVEATDVVNEIVKYADRKSIMEDSAKAVLDMKLLEDESILEFIKAQSKNGLTNKIAIDAASGSGSTDVEIPDSTGKNTGDDKKAEVKKKDPKKEDAELLKKYRMCIACLAFYAFLTHYKIEKLDDILRSIEDENIDKDEKERNERLFRNLQLNREFIEKHIENCSRSSAFSIDDILHRADKLSKDDDLTEEERITNAMNRFSRISDSEVVTPQKVCGKMFDILCGELPGGVDELARIVENGGRVLDISGKTGEFALAFYNLLRGKVSEEKLKNAVYTIPTSTVTYEFIRLIYELLGFNIDNIADKFTAYDLMKIRKIRKSGKHKGEATKNVDYDRISQLLKQNKKMSEIRLDDKIDEGAMKLKFDFVIGNPPYQENTLGENETFAPPVYDKFMDAAFKIADKVELIHPARFLFNAGGTASSWNEKMLNDECFKVLCYESDSKKLFNNIGIGGGVAITYRDANKNYGKIKTFISNEILRSIFNKVTSNTKEYLSQIIVLQNRYLLNTLLSEHPECVTEISGNGTDKRFRTNAFERVSLFHENEQADDIKVFGLINNNRVYRYINKRYFDTDHENLFKYKAVVPKAYGSGIVENESAFIIGKPEILSPNVGYTQSFIGIGSYNTLDEATNTLKYLKSKFCRICVGILKVTQDNPPEKWRYVPKQDFSNSSDINWSKSVKEIDLQLFEKYGLSNEEIKYINERVKEME